MSKNKFLLIILFFSNFTLQAQYSRLNIEAYTGTPLSLTFFTPSVAPFGGFGVRYCLLKEISIAGHIDIGTITGKNPSPNKTFSTPDDNNNYSGYTNNFFQYTLEGQFNLERIFLMRGFLHRLNPFIVVGGGILNGTESATRVNNLGERSYPAHNFYTAHIGLNFRYYLNPTLDLFFGANFNQAQTKFLDAVPVDGKLDNYMLNYIGISYKVGARKDKQNIEWNNVILKDRIYIPDIEKHIGQPLDAAGNYFMFHKDTINKILAQNADLQDRSKKLEEKSNDLEMKNSQQQKQIDSMQSQIIAIKTTLDTLKENVSNQNVPVEEVKAISKNKRKAVVKNSKINNNNEAVFVPKSTASVPKKELKTKKDISDTQKTKTNIEPDQLATQETNVQTNSDKKKRVAKEQPVVKENITVQASPKSDKKGKAEAIKRDNIDEGTPAKPSHHKAIEHSETTKEISSNKNVTPSNTLTEGLNKIENVVTPVATYNIIAGAYIGEKYADIFRDKMRSKGYQAAVFKSNLNSKIYRVCIFTSDDKSETVNVLRKVRSEIVPDAWIHVYHQK